MAKDTVAIVEAAVEDVFGVLANGPKSNPDARRGINLLFELQSALISMYTPVKVVTIVDATDASPTAFFAATGQSEGKIGVGQVFETQGGVADFTDNALATAKGGAVASGDKFERLTATTVKYLGADFTFTGETESDW